MPPMSDNHERFETFAREYVIDHNGSRAAIAAGYSPKAAKEQASRLLTRANVRRIVERLESQRASKLEIKAERVLEEIHRLAMSNLEDYIRVNADGQADVDLSALTRDQAAAIGEISVDTTGGTGDGERRQVLRTKIKLIDKTKNLELLCRHLGMFNDKLQVTGLESLADKMNQIRTKKNADATT